MSLGVPDAAWPALAARLDGDLLRPGEGDFGRVSRPDDARFAGVVPLAVVRCAGEDDVREALAFVRRHDLPMAVRSGGHDFAGRSTTVGVLVDLALIDHVDSDDVIARVGVGARLPSVYAALHQAGRRTLPGGSGATVAIGGLTLGGGLGLLGRAHGLTCDALVGARVVLADGRAVDCSADEHADLFWALRGAGGAASFGIVTELVFHTVHAPDCAVFSAEWSARHAGHVLGVWPDWAPDAPREVAASLLLTASADVNAPPRVTVLGCVAGGDADRVEQFVDDLARRVTHAPLVSSSESCPWPETGAALGARSPGVAGGRQFARSEFVGDRLPLALTERLVALLTTDRIAGEARELDLTPWAGAYGDHPADATAFPHRSARFLVKQTATLVDDELAVPGPWLNRSWEAVHEVGTGGVYPNFPDPALADPASAYFGANLPRLRAVKRAHDPTGLFPAVGGGAAERTR